MKKLLLSILLVVSISANAQFWAEKATGFTTPGRGLYSISIVDANVVWALGSDNTTDPADLTIKEFTKSTDGGNTWTPGTMDLGAATNELGISSITATSSTTSWVSAYPDTFGTIQVGGIWKTIDGGVIWTKQTTALFSSSESYANFVYFWDADNGIAAGDPESGEFEIYTTTDGGTTWTRVSGANIPDPIAGDEYGYENLYAISGNTIWFGTDLGRIFKSTDKGLTWTAHQSPSADFSSDKFSFSDTSKGLLSIHAIPKLLYSTLDGGENWSPVTTSLINTDIAYIPGTSTVIATNWNDPYSSSYSLDDGATWTQIDAIPHGIAVFLNSSFGFSGGFNTNATTGGIFKFSGIPLKAPSFDLKNQITAYPNPTNGILNINSENSLIKEASIFDLLGRQVYKPKFSVLNNVTLDLHSLQTGAYILKVTSDSGVTETMKIMKK
ncbi:MAG: hypothetical protein C0412_00145 [Flavobacterium sp.]|nr:hypothetical protein [Flavobacterium sp.]